MSAEPTTNRETDEEHASFYTAGCYPVPIRFLYGTAAEINFWDLIYYRTYKGEGTFETSTLELADQTGLGRQEVGRLRREAIEHGELIEDISFESGRRFQLKIPDFDRLKKGIIWKPLGYVENGWYRIVTPAIPKRVLNLYLQQPRQQIYHLEVGRITAKCQRHFPFGDYKPTAPLNAVDVSRAIRLLIKLGLFIPDRDGLRIDWMTFNRPAPTTPPRFEAPDPHDHQSFIECYAIDPIRAERALELLLIGQYEMEMHFTDIFRDLAYIYNDDDYQTLRNKVYKRRGRPPGPNRWYETWRIFLSELKRRWAEIRFPKVAVDLGGTTFVAVPLSADLRQAAQPISAVVLVTRAEWPWHFQDAAPVYLDVRSFDKVLFARSLSAGDAEVRFAFRADQWSDVLRNLTLQARCDRPLPGVHIEAWLEAKLRK